MKQLIPALVESVLAGAFAASIWALADVDPNLWQFTASAIGAYFVLESVRALRRHVDRRAAQN